MAKNDTKPPGCCSPKRCCITTCCLLAVLLATILVWYFKYFKSEEEPLARCGDCFCIVGDSENNTCPSTEPRSNYTISEIIRWKRQKIVNPYTLQCDPFSDMGCKTTPEQSESLLKLLETAVCAIHGVEATYNTSSCEGESFRLETYPSREEAEAAGGFVTHLGHCGVCSTLQDLAVYMENPGLTTEGKFCNSQDSFALQDGLACYRNLGMSDDCAKVWSDSETNTLINCFQECFLKDILQDEPNNGPAPECKINECLQCDQETSVDSLAMIAGRTRRRSGLLSPVARKCDEMAIIEHLTCPETTPV